MTEKKYVINLNKYIGAFIGLQEASATVSSANSSFINEVFKFLGEGSLFQNLRTVGNNTSEIAGVAVIAPEEGSSDTQFEAITNSNVKSGLYAPFTASLLWSIDSTRFPKLLFSDFEDIEHVTDEEELIDKLTNYKYATIILDNDIYLSKNWDPLAFKGNLIGKESSGVFPTIYNLNISSSDGDVGFFSSLESASLSNFNIVAGGQKVEPGNGDWHWTGDFENSIISTNIDNNSKTAILAANVKNSSIKKHQY